MAIWERDQDHSARRREASTKKREASAERSEIQNAKAKQKLKDKEARNRIRAQNGGTGFMVVAINTSRHRKKPQVRRKTVNRSRSRTGSRR